MIKFSLITEKNLQKDTIDHVEGRYECQRETKVTLFDDKARAIAWLKKLKR